MTAMNTARFRLCAVLFGAFAWLGAGGAALAAERPLVFAVNYPLAYFAERLGGRGCSIPCPPRATTSLSSRARSPRSRTCSRPSARGDGGGQAGCAAGGAASGAPRRGISTRKNRV